MNMLAGFAVLAIQIQEVSKATLLVTAVGLVIGVFLSLAAKFFEVPVDEREEQVRGLLPGNNCGACGYPGCDNLAEAIAAGNAKPNACPIATSDAHLAIAGVMGTDTEVSDKQVAFVKCAGTCDKTKDKYTYVGKMDCKQAAMNSGGGPKKCGFSCLGYGTCVSACQFDALHIVDGIAVVDKEKCTSCGLCIPECPKNLIEFVPYKTHHFVRCNSTDKGKVVKEGCTIGCIGCKICEKVCEFDAVHVKDNLALIDYAKCTNCMKCAEKCPTKVILSELIKVS